ncbi:very short patch repair endonuclease [Biformimicrobium ophioploci]|uniref:very short patch repair endonuclease n=1 Tax=Biformimicrobium ophioploci TaxID=3036711 RepID=UPI00255661EC|nr:DNA mismatch endonuclease Vsr [Microbulbifer sp. NKW57]
MTDTVSKGKRSEMMAGIGRKDTKPELMIRKALHSLGFRYRLHCGKLPGKPDLVFPRYRAIILVNGCFWHGHHCHLFRLPKTNTQFWKEKIAANCARDRKNQEMYAMRDWRVLIIWECSLKGKTKLPFDEVIDRAVEWLLSDIALAEISTC